MKYMLMFCGTEKDRARQERLTAEAYQQEFGKVMQWLQDLGPKLVTSGRFQPPATATTVRFSDEGAPAITDGPFIEAKEAIGGFAVVDLPDLDEALKVARAWPAGGCVEVRPFMEAPPRR
ncbi:MAG TPA: YciI family protein [Chloroflexota bacterium]|nr:YciI family protein [Chloroflexota bacterium]